MSDLPEPEDLNNQPVRERLLAFLKGSAPSAVQVGADLLLPGTGTVAAALFGGVVQLIDAIGTRRAQRAVEETFDEIKRRLTMVEASQVDLLYLFSDEFLLELRRMLELAAKTDSDEKLRRAKDFLVNKFLEPPKDAAARALDEFVSNFMAESSELELRMTMILEEAPVTEGEPSSAVHDAVIEQLTASLGLSDDSHDLVAATIERLCSRGIAASLGTWGGTRSLRGLTSLGAKVKHRLLEPMQ
ncbi:MAG: hypothetical protein M5U25_16220 [Planctomycetota bacterium]|nr:hypothetical protein [Planctomycetota bacterium]